MSTVETNSTSAMPPAPQDASHVDSLTAIRLIASRELTTRVRTKGFRVLTGIMLFVVVATVLAFHLVSGSGIGQSKVGIAAGHDAVAGALVATGKVMGQDISTVTVPNDENGRAEVLNGNLDAYLTLNPHGVHAVVDKDLGSSLRGVITVVARNAALDAQIAALGGDPAAVNAAVARTEVTVEALTPQPSYDPQRLVLGAAAGILIYISLLIGGQLVAQGVVEEKSSRVIELLLSTVRPWQLMTGKVLGLGAVGLIQVALYGVVGVGLASALGTLDIAVSAAAGSVIWLIVWYLVGFILYAFIFAGAGALVSRQEDAAGVITPVTMIVIVGYVIGISVLPSDPGNTFAGVMSLIPLFAPTLMPIRLAMGAVPAWEAALSLVLAAGSIPLFALIAGRIYRNAAIHIGSRMPLRKALAK